MSRKGKPDEKKRLRKERRKLKRRVVELVGGCVGLFIAVPFGMWLAERATSVWYVPGFFTYLRDFYF